MKYLSLLIIALLLSSCCATKQVTTTSKKEIAKIESVKAEETMEVPEVIIEEKKPEATEKTIPEPPKPPVLEEVDVIDHYAPEAFNHTKWNSLLQEHVSESGNVNYKAIKNNPTELHVYIDSLGENMPTESWSNEDKLAYWMNAYNAMTVDLIIRNYPVKSIKDIKDPWEQRLWKLGEKWYNLDEIEHQILRKMNEPRIHFGIVCASFSCPKLQNEAFEAWQLEAQLTAATEEFLSDTKRNTITENNLQLSKIFQWFAKDFKQNGSLIDFLNTYSETEISSKAKKRYRTYNWDLND